MINIFNTCNSRNTSWRNSKKKIQRISKIKPFINKYNWKELNYPSGEDYWKKFEKSNPTIALNALYVKQMNIYLYIKTQLKPWKTNHSFNDYRSCNNSKRKRLALPQSKNTVCTIKGNIVKACWWFLFELSSYV